MNICWTPTSGFAPTNPRIRRPLGETIKAYTAKYGSAGQLIAIPLGIAGWLRYMMGIDDQGNPYTLAPDPLAGEMTEILKDIEIGKPETLKDQLKPVLSNETIFFTNLMKMVSETRSKNFSAK